MRATRMIEKNLHVGRLTCCVMRRYLIHTKFSYYQLLAHVSFDRLLFVHFKISLVKESATKKASLEQACSKGSAEMKDSAIYCVTSARSMICALSLSLSVKHRCKATLDLREESLLWRVVNRCNSSRWAFLSKLLLVCVRTHRRFSPPLPLRLL